MPPSLVRKVIQPAIATVWNIHNLNTSLSSISSSDQQACKIHSLFNDYTCKLVGSQLVSWMWSWFTLSSPYFRLPCSWGCSCCCCSCCSYWSRRCVYARGDGDSGSWQNIVVDPGKNIFMRNEHIDSISEKTRKSSTHNAQQCVASSRISAKIFKLMGSVSWWLDVSTWRRQVLHCLRGKYVALVGSLHKTGMISAF